mgnify:CR=1 FL=1
MTFFNRWYIQKTITKIKPAQALELLEAAEEGFPTVPPSDTLKQKLIDEAGEINLCNIKLPLSKVRELWGLTSNDVIDLTTYNAIISSADEFSDTAAADASNPGGDFYTFDPDEFTIETELLDSNTGLIPGFEFRAMASYEYNGKVHNSTIYAASESEAIEIAKNKLQQKLNDIALEKEVTTLSNSLQAEKFSEAILKEIREGFLEHESDKIPKVGQYLKGEVIDLPALERNIQSGEGRILADRIHFESTYIFTGKLYLSLGSQDSSIVNFQILFFIPDILVNTSRSEGGLTILSLSEIRLLACSPKKPKKRKRKVDDPKNRDGVTDGYRTRDQRKRRQLNRRQKNNIAEAVRTRILNVADSSFIRALANVDNIRTTQDAFDFVLNVLPLQDLIQLGLECASKYINESPEDVVCKTIMDNLESEDVQNVLKYIDANATTDVVAASFRQYIVDEFNNDVGGLIELDPTGLSSQFKNFLINQFNTNITNRQIICAVIYASLPAAITLLALYIEEERPKLEDDGTCADPLSPLAEAVKSRLENPAKAGLNYIKDVIYNHPIVGLAANFTDTFYNQVIMFVDQIIVQAIAIFLQELAYLCEDSDRSDLANALYSNDAYDNTIQDILTSRVAYDDTADYIDDLVNNSPENFDDCESILFGTDLIEDFFDDLTKALTVSEVCILFNGDPMSLNYNLAVDKIYFGLLRITKYKCLRKALDTKNKFIQFIDIFGEYINQVACQNKIEEHTKNKKLISELCESSDAGFVDDLSSKVSDDLLQKILADEEENLRKLLGVIKDFVDPPIPEPFCGPQAEANGKTPMLSTFQEDSQLYLSKKFLTSIFTAAEKLFESEIDNFKVILTNPVSFNAPQGPDLGKFFTAASEIANTMSKVYNVELKGADGNPLNTPTQDALEIYLKNLTNSGKLVAPALRSNLTSIKSDLKINFLEEDVFEISTQNYNFGRLKYILNYSDEEVQLEKPSPDFDDDLLTISPGTSKLIFIASPAPGQIEETAAAYQTDLGGNFPTMPTSLFGYGYFAANSKDNSEYLSIINQNVYTKQFYAQILEQIIREHAEFVSSSDLFQRKFFDQLPLSKSNFCGSSLLKYDDVLEKMENRIKKVECYTGIGVVPTPSEKVLLASVYESMIRVVVAIEMMKSFFVFSSFGLNALMPSIDENGNDGDDVLNSFYFSYLTEQIVSKVDEFIPLDKVELVEKVVEEVIAADHDLNEPSISFSIIRRDLIQNAVTSLQDQVFNALTKVGFKTKLGSDGVRGVLFDEASLLSDPAMGPTSKAQEFLNNVTPTTSPYDGRALPPPTISRVATESVFEFTAAEGGNPVLGNIDVAFEIEPLYSQIPELVNGGIFIERGIEILHNRPSTGTTLDGVNTSSAARSDKNSITPEEILLLLKALPESVPETLYFSGYNTGNGYPLGENSNNILNILGANINLNPVGVTLKNSANQLAKIQRNLFGGQAINTNGDISSTLLKADSPYGLDPTATAQSDIYVDQNDFYKRQGRIPLNSENISMIVDIFSQMDEFSDKLKQGIFDNYANVMDEAGASSVKDILSNLYGAFTYDGFASQLTYLRTRMRTIDTYFYKLGTYQTLNLLIRVDQTEDAAEGGLQQIIQQLMFDVDIASQTDDAKYNLSSFSNALLDRKFILIDGGITYFKLPISYSFKPFDKSLSLDTPISDLFPGFAASDELTSLLSSLQYENILSFVSIFVTNSLSYAYPELDSIFNKTLVTLQSAMLNQMAVMDRVEDQTYYANNFNEQQLGQYQESEMNILILFLEGILKAVANMTDPTWRTPWFLPGPLTPFGILAKLISGEDDVDDPVGAASKNQVPPKDVYGTDDCQDEQ